MSSSLLLAQQQATELAVITTAGQSFLTWRKVPGNDSDYRVYRSGTLIQSADDLSAADLLGEVDSFSGYNARRSFVENFNRNWVIPPGVELANTQGLFVYTIENCGAPSCQAFYAVTAILPLTGENTSIDTSAGGNSTALVTETPAPPEPILQGTAGNEETWAHWTSDRNTPFQQAMFLEPSHAFNFRIVRGTAPGLHGLVVRCHHAGRSGHYGASLLVDSSLVTDLDFLFPDDFLIGPVNKTYWFGAHTRYPELATGNEVVVPFTLARVFWTIRWTSLNMGATLDKTRIYAVGVSMGAIGTMRLVEERPDLFAAAYARDASFDFIDPDSDHAPDVQELWGTYDLDLPTVFGSTVWDHLHSGIKAQEDPATDWPILRTINGRNDTVARWGTTVPFFGAMASPRRPAVHYWDEREHGLPATGFWTPLEETLILRTFEHRLDRPILRFDDFSLDDDPGDGSPEDGDLIGTINAGLDFDRITAMDGPDFAQFDVALRDEGAMDDALFDSAWVRMTPRRLRNFRLVGGDIVHFTLRDDGTLTDEHLLFADSLGFVQTPPSLLTSLTQVARFDRWDLPGLPHLFVGDAPMLSDEFQSAVFGNPGDSYALYYSRGTGSATDPICGVTLGIDRAMVLQQGVIPFSGVADIFITAPSAPALSGTTFQVQAVVDCTVTDVIPFTFQ